MDDVRIEAAARALHSFSMSTLPLEEAPATYRREQMRRAEAMLANADAVDPLRNQRIIETIEELDAAIIRSLEQGENLVLLDGWRPWVIWENDYGDVRVSSLPVEGDPNLLSLSDINLPATVLHEPRA